MHEIDWTATGRRYAGCSRIGHGPPALQYDGVASLLTRGTEWAATGAVSVPLREKARAYLAEVPAK